MQPNMIEAIQSRPVASIRRERKLMAMIAALYFTQGLPMGLSMEALPVMMRQAGVSLDVIALVPLASLPWILKLFWAPFVENHWSRALGRRRTWILSMQAILAASFLVLGLSPLSGAGLWMAVAALAIGSLASATQDTATDGLAAERLAGRQLAMANAFQIGGMMGGFITGGGGVLMFADHFGQFAIMCVLALVPAISILLAALWREEENGGVARHERAHLGGTFRRSGIVTLLLLAATYGGAHAGGMSVSRILLVDLGWSNAETGLIATIGGIVMIAAGCPLGAWLTAANRWHAVAIGMISAGATFLFWAAIAAGYVPASWSFVVIATAMLSIASGIIAVSAATIIMVFGGAGHQAGTDVTVLQSANVTGEMFFSGLAVWAAGQGGFGLAFAGAAIAVLGAAAIASRFGPRAVS